MRLIWFIVIGLAIVYIAVQLWAIRRRRVVAEALDEIARQLGLIVGRMAGTDAEILGVEGRMLVMRVRSDTLRLSLEKLIKIHLQHAPDKRVWHYEQLLAEAQRQADSDE